MRPHRRQPTRHCRPWDSLGKNTGVGCHFLLQCMKVKSESEVPPLCLTLSDPMHCSPAVSSVHGIFQARVLEWVAMAFSVTPAITNVYSVATILAQTGSNQDVLQKVKIQTSLVVQWLRLHTPNAGGLGLIPVQGTRSHKPQLKIPHVATKTWYSQINT